MGRYRGHFHQPDDIFCTQRTQNNLMSRGILSVIGLALVNVYPANRFNQGAPGGTVFPLWWE